MIKKINNAGTVNNIINIQSVKTKENINLKDMDGYFYENFFFTDIYDEKKFQRFIKTIEKQIRTSNEYSNYIGFLNNELGLRNCAILGNIEKGDADVEMHHYPYTLYDIVYVCVSRNILLKKKFNSFTIIKEVLTDHYNNIIGVVPLAKTVHQLAHAGEVFINLSQVYGNLNKFNEKYSFAMTDDMIDKFNLLVKKSHNNTIYSETDILQKNKDFQ